MPRDNAEQSGPGGAAELATDPWERVSLADAEDARAGRDRLARLILERAATKFGA